MPHQVLMSIDRDTLLSLLIPLLPEGARILGFWFDMPTEAEESRGETQVLRVRLEHASFPDTHSGHLPEIEMLRKPAQGIILRGKKKTG